MQTKPPPHSFVIPVMGTGFTLDSPLRVGRLGITSTMSAVDDVLMEQVRRSWLKRTGKPCDEIDGEGGHARARRIEAYLNFVADTLDVQMAVLASEPFLPGSDICRYFQLLPDSPLKRRFTAMEQLPHGIEREREEAALRTELVPGRADVNIMTKVDRRKNARGEERASDDSDALSALRGFARSRLRSALVLSAGMNPRLFGYAAQFDCFFPNTTGHSDKQLILKVSDFRSAVLQGKVLAKKGLWVSEFRIESGLNCGGHAFASGGLLLGPILATFQRERAELRQQLFELCAEALQKGARPVPASPPEQRVTVQGGIGTHAEDAMLRQHYAVDATGWGSPFLLVDDATAVDHETRERLCDAKPTDIELSHASPLGVRFWNLTTSQSECARRDRIAAGKPGSSCPKGFLANNEEETSVPVCLASRAYQRVRLARLATATDSNGSGRHEDEKRATAKACLCHDLGGSIALLYGVDRSATPAICPGPNIVHFKRELMLEELVGHIYGRNDVLTSTSRPHMFLQELGLTRAYLDEMAQAADPSDARAQKQVIAFRDHVRDGVMYYLSHLSLFGQQEHAAERMLTRVLAGLQSEIAVLSGTRIEKLSAADGI